MSDDKTVILSFRITPKNLARMDEAVKEGSYKDRTEIIISGIAQLLGLNTEPRLCSSCKTENIAEADYCMECGAKLASVP